MPLDQPDSEHPHDADVEVLDNDEGGPVKSFLEHLEDLRWVLIKSSVTIGVAMMICLIGGNYVVGVIKRPLEKAKINYSGKEQVAVVLLGTNRLQTLRLDDAQRQSFLLPTNRYLAVRVEPVAIGSNVVLTVRNDPTVDAKELAEQMKVDLSTLSPAGGFMVAFQVAFYAGLAVSSPFIFYFLAQFIFPALKWNEKKYIYRGLGFAIPLFILGVCFCYFLLMPVALAASQLYSTWLGLSADIWRAEDYISFVCKFMLGMGLGFEMPVVILVLVKLGILNYAILSKARRYMIVINLVLGAVLTTPEVLTQVLMAIPLQILYEISVWIAWYWERQERKRAREAGEDTE